MRKNKDIKQISEALMKGYHDGIYWDYKNPYSKSDQLWIEYYYGYLIGLILPEREQA